MQRCLYPLIALPLLLSPGRAAAQVTLNPDALKQVKPAATAPVTPAAPEVKRPVVKTAPRTPPPAKLTPPVVAVIPPEIAQLPPPVAVPTRPAEKIVAPAPVANAIGSAVAIKDGLRLDFGAGSSDLNQAMDKSLRAFAARAKPGPVALDAYASGNDSDPSTPRRLSLARVLAARAILIDAGIASKDIYPRAHAPDTSISGAPADRLDIVIVASNHS